MVSIKKTEHNGAKQQGAEMSVEKAREGREGEERERERETERLRD